MDKILNTRREARLRNWEISLLVALCITVLTGVWARAEQQSLASKLIRLHVVAASDEDEQQRLKLEVRDRLLERLEPELEGVNDQEEARIIIEGLLPELEEISRTASADWGMPLDAQAAIAIESYPTREYDSFSLPAGEYLSLRVILGEGEGKNWWCVVFPPLCLSAAEGGAVEVSGLSGKDVALITEDGEGYVLKFKLVELFGNLVSRLER